MRAVLAALAALAAIGLGEGPAAAQHLPAVESAHYARCMERARKDPAAARDDADAWRGSGGGHPAEHCAAVALIGLGQYKEAATRLEQLADAMFKSPVDLRAGVLGQAGQAWLVAGDAARSAAALTRAIDLTPGDPDLLTDRAQAEAAQGKYDAALADLDRALAGDPHRVDSLVFRAAARRAKEQLDPALSDAEAALAITPDQPDALLERGNIRHLKGDDAAARRDWRRIAEHAPGTPAAAAAKANLARLDAEPAGPPPAPAVPKPGRAPPKSKPN